MSFIKLLICILLNTQRCQTSFSSVCLCVFSFKLKKQEQADGCTSPKNLFHTSDECEKVCKSVFVITFSRKRETGKGNKAPRSLYMRIQLIVYQSILIKAGLQSTTLLIIAFYDVLSPFLIKHWSSASRAVNYSAWMFSVSPFVIVGRREHLADKGPQAVAKGGDPISVFNCVLDS